MRFLPLIPTETSLILKYLVDHLLKHKLHKTQLFVLDGKTQEKKSLLKSIRQGDLPSRLSSYSSRSISFVIRHLLADCYAPLLSYDQFPTLVESLECWSVRIVMDAMAPERRGLLDSILLLLYKLALNSGGGGSQSDNVATMSGETLGAILTRPSEEELVESLVDRQRIGAFLVENAPELLRKRDEARIESRGSSVGAALEHSRFADEGEKSRYDEYKYQARRFSRRGDESDSEGSAEIRRHDHPPHQSPRISPPRQHFQQPLSVDQSPKRRRSSLLSSAMLPMGSQSSSSEIRSRTLAQPPASPRTPVYQAAVRDSLSSSDVAMLQRLLTVIVESPQDKRGLFVERPRRDEESKVLEQLLQLNVGKNLSFLPLESFSVLTLALFVNEFFLKSQAEPLLGVDALEELLSASLGGEQEVEISRMLQEILETKLDKPRRDFVTLLSECVRLALVSGSDQYELEDAVARCLFGSCEEAQGAQGRFRLSGCVMFYNADHFQQCHPCEMR